MSLDFKFSPEQEELKQTVAQVGRKHTHLIHSCDRDSEVPQALYEEMGQHKWMGPFVPQEYGGMGKGAVEFAIITEEISRVGFMGHNPVAQLAQALLGFGTEEQKQRYLPGLSDGSLKAAVAISEENAGSNWDLMETTATPQDGGWLLKGHKAHINYGELAQVLLIYAKTAKGISVFLVEGGHEGLSFKKGDPIGLRMEPIADINIDQVWVPQDALLGEEGKPLQVFFPSFNLSRIGNACRMLGIARGAMDTAITYAKEKDVRGNKVTDFQGLRWFVAEIHAKMEAASLVNYRAAWKIDQGLDPALDVACAKLLSASVADEVTSKVFSLTGGWGLYREQPFEKFWRDVQVGKVGGGSLEILKNFIARRILGKPSQGS